MRIDEGTLVPISEANNDFSKIARMAEQYGSVVILKDNEPRYVLMDYNLTERNTEVSEQELLHSSEKMLERNKYIYEELAK